MKEKIKIGKSLILIKIMIGSLCAALSVSVNPTEKTLKVGESITFTATATGASGTPSYEWSPSGVGPTKTYTALEADRGQVKSVSVTCTDGICPPVTAAASVYVPKVEFESVSGADDLGSDTFATAVGSGDVVIKLKMTPSQADSSALSVTWTGGASGSNMFERKISKSTLSYAGIDVEAKFGESVIKKMKIYIFPAKPSSTTIDKSGIVLERDDGAIGAGNYFGATGLGAALAAKNEYVIFYENKKWKFIYSKIEYKIKYGIYSQGRTDVPDPVASPFPLGMNMSADSSESLKKLQAKTDLTPDSDGVAIRTKYWSQALTIQHENFHFSDFRNNFHYEKIAAAKTEIEAIEIDVTSQNLDPVSVKSEKVTDLDDIVKEKTQEALDNYGVNNHVDAEIRAYADGRLGYVNLSNEITL